MGAVLGPALRVQAAYFTEAVCFFTPSSSEQQQRLLKAFIGAAQKGDLAALEGLFAEDVVSYSDGGGIVRTAARASVYGRERVAKFIATFATHFWTGITLRWIETNGQEPFERTNRSVAA